MRSVLTIQSDIAELGLVEGDAIVVQPEGGEPLPDRWYVLATPDDTAFARTSVRKGEVVWRYADTSNLVLWDPSTHRILARIVERRHRM